MRDGTEDIGAMLDEFASRASGTWSPGYNFVGQAIDAAAVVLEAINSAPSPSLAEIIHTDGVLHGDTRAGLIDKFLEGVKGIEAKHGLHATLSYGNGAYTVSFTHI